MKKRILGFIIAIMAVIAIIAITVKAAEFETWYTHTDLKLRAAPTTDSDVITVYQQGSELSVIGTDGGSWWEVYDGERQGWVHKDYMVDAPDKYALGEYIGVFWTTGYNA